MLGDKIVKEREVIFEGNIRDLDEQLGGLRLFEKFKTKIHDIKIAEYDGVFLYYDSKVFIHLSKYWDEPSVWAITFCGRKEMNHGRKNKKALTAMRNDGEFEKIINGVPWYQRRRMRKFISYVEMCMDKKNYQVLPIIIYAPADFLRDLIVYEK